MRRLLLALIAGLAVFSVTAAAASFHVSPTVLQALTFDVHVDVPDPPEDPDDPGDGEEPDPPESEVVVIEWDDQGEEPIDESCVGEVDWKFVLTRQPGGAAATLDVTFTEDGQHIVDGEQQGRGQVGAIHFEITTPAGEDLESATATVEGGDPEGLLTLSETNCHPDPDGGGKDRNADAAGGSGDAENGEAGENDGESAEGTEAADGDAGE